MKKGAVIVSWAITAVVLLGWRNTLVSYNQKYRILRAESAMFQSHLREALHEIVQELEGVPKEQRITIFKFVQDLDAEVARIRSERSWHGGYPSIAELIERKEIEDPTTGGTTHR